MKTKPELIPDFIFDRIQQSAFSELCKDEQQIVLLHFSEEEYSVLHDSAIALGNYTLKDKPVQSDSKTQVLNYFDRRERKAATGFISQSSFIWKAACILFLCSTLYMSFLLWQRQSAAELNAITKYDTIFVQKPQADKAAVSAPSLTSVPKVSVAYKTKSKGVAALKEKRLNDKAKAETSGDNPGILMSGTAIEVIPVMSVGQMHSAGNSSKKNSMQDDSLERNFRFVSL